MNKVGGKSRERMGERGRSRRREKRREGRAERGGKGEVYLSWGTASAYSKAPAHQPYKRCALLLLLLLLLLMLLLLLLLLLLLSHVFLELTFCSIEVVVEVEVRQLFLRSKNCFHSVDWPVSNRTASNRSRRGWREVGVGGVSWGGGGQKCEFFMERNSYSPKHILRSVVVWKTNYGIFVRSLSSIINHAWHCRPFCGPFVCLVEFKVFLMG